MLRLFYTWILRCHPGAFRQRFGDEMLSIFDQASANEGKLSGVRLLGDCIVSLMRQRVLRPRFDKETAIFDQPIASGVPAFHIIDEFKPRSSALVHGAMLSVAVFCAAFLAMRYSVTHRVHLILPMVERESESASPEMRQAIVPIAALDEDAHEPATRQSPEAESNTQESDTSQSNPAERRRRPPAAKASPRREGLHVRQGPPEAAEGSASTQTTAGAQASVITLPPLPPKPDFSGEWILNVAKSNFGGKPAPVSAALKIVHADPDLKILRNIVSRNGALTAETLYSTDGRTTFIKLPTGSEMKGEAKWQGPVLVIDTPSKLACAIEWRWTLSPDGRTLVTVRRFSDEEQTQTEVYEKK